MQFRYFDRNADAWIDLIFGEGGDKIRLPQAPDEGKPGSGLEIVRKVFFDETTGGGVGNAEVFKGAIVEDRAKDVAVMLAPAIDPALNGVPGNVRGDIRLGACVVGSAIRSGGDGKVVWFRFVIGFVVVVERRYLKQSRSIEGCLLYTSRCV